METDKDIPTHYPFVLFPGQYELPSIPIEFKKPVKKLFMGYHFKLFDSSYERELSYYNKYVRELYLYNEIIGSEENLAIYRNKILYESIKRANELGDIYEPSQRKGKTEKIFYDFLRKKLGKNIQIDKEITKRFLFNGEFGYYQYSEKYGKPYMPDIVYDEDFGSIHIDIEIDEPYTLSDESSNYNKTYKPIHFLGGDDEKRDDFFVFNNWVVLRFAEEQIVNNIEDCGKIVQDVVNFLTDLLKNEGEFKSWLELKTYGIKKVKRWTKVEAEEMAENNYRESYLIALNTKYENSEVKTINNGVNNNLIKPKQVENYKINIEKPINKVESKSDIGRTLLNSKEEQMIVDFFVRHPKFFVELISVNFSFSNRLISKLEDKLSWKDLSRNSNLVWSYEFFERYINKIDWSWISLNSAITHNFEFIERYKNKLNFRYLTSCKNIKWTNQVIDKYIEQWDWEILSGKKSENFIWSLDIIERYKENWDWRYLSSNPKLPWSIDFFEKYKDKFDWGWLSGNPNIPWSIELIEKYKNKWQWDYLSSNFTPNINILWTITTIEKFKDHWNWDRLIRNNNIPWTIDLVEKYKYKWEKFIFGKNVDWSLELIDKYQEKLDWEYLSSVDYLPWSIKLIKRYEDKWSWNYLSRNRFLPWSSELLEKFEHYWIWSEFKNNNNIPWTFELLRKYENNWEWKHLTMYDNQIWEKVFIDKVNEKIIESVFEKINK